MLRGRRSVTLVDSNVLIDILAISPGWFDWAADQLEQLSQRGPLYFNEIVYAELAVKSESEAQLDRALADLGLQLYTTPKSALFLAGKVFGQYRRAGGARASNLPDFFIGAHAQVTGLPLLTRDVARYRTYFPKVKLIAPN
jgi:predicted nucleic acid-binding protein